MMLLLLDCLRVCLHTLKFSVKVLACSKINYCIINCAQNNSRSSFETSVDKICTDYSWSTLDGLWMDFRWTTLMADYILVICRWTTLGGPL